MALSEWEINFNYQKAVQQSDDLRAVARELRSTAEDDFEEILDELNRVWQSDNSPQYFRKGNKVIADMTRTAQNLEQIATIIRTIAERIRRAESDALRIANERTY